jgi:hypothetical protein
VECILNHAIGCRRYLHKEEKNNYFMNAFSTKCIRKNLKEELVFQAIFLILRHGSSVEIKENTDGQGP